MTDVLFDCRNLSLYPMAKSGFRGGTELAVERIAHGLAENGFVVHVVTKDADQMERRGDSEFWWPATMHPSRADVVVMVAALAGAEDYEADCLIYFTNGAELPNRLTPEVAGLVSAYPVFSRKHGELLCKLNPAIPPERCVVTGLGVDTATYTAAWASICVAGHTRTGLPIDEVFAASKVPGRIWVGNDPARGLVNTLDIFDLVKERVPHATLHVTYDLERQFARVKWQHNAAAEVLWECKRRLENTPGVTLLGAVSREEVVRQQLEAQVHLWPSDPVNVGSQIHGLSQLEAAAAGCALVLSDVEAFPEVFGEAATILPTIGTFAPGPDEDGSRIDAQDYADAVVELMTDAAKWAEASRKARKLAEKMTWEDVTGQWLLMLDLLAAQKEAA